MIWQAECVCGNLDRSCLTTSIQGNQEYLVAQLPRPKQRLLPIVRPNDFHSAPPKGDLLISQLNKVSVKLMDGLVEANLLCR